MAGYKAGMLCVHILLDDKDKLTPTLLDVFAFELYFIENNQRCM